MFECKYSCFCRERLPLAATSPPGTHGLGGAPCGASRRRSHRALQHSPSLGLVPPSAAPVSVLHSGGLLHAVSVLEAGV